MGSFNNFLSCNQCLLYKLAYNTQNLNIVFKVAWELTAKIGILGDLGLRGQGIYWKFCKLESLDPGFFLEVWKLGTLVSCDTGMMG